MLPCLFTVFITHCFTLSVFLIVRLITRTMWKTWSRVYDSAHDEWFKHVYISTVAARLSIILNATQRHFYWSLLTSGKTTPVLPFFILICVCYFNTERSTGKKRVTDF